MVKLSDATSDVTAPPASPLCAHTAKRNGAARNHQVIGRRPAAQPIRGASFVSRVHCFHHSNAQQTLRYPNTTHPPILTIDHSSPPLTFPKTPRIHVTMSGNITPIRSAPMAFGTPNTPTGSWRHPAMDAITKRKSETSFTTSCFYRVSHNAAALVLSFFLVAVLSNRHPPRALPSHSQCINNRIVKPLPQSSVASCPRASSATSTTPSGPSACSSSTISSSLSRASSAPPTNARICRSRPTSARFSVSTRPRRCPRLSSRPTSSPRRATRRRLRARAPTPRCSTTGMAARMFRAGWRLGRLRRRERRGARRGHWGRLRWHGGARDRALRLLPVR